MPSEEVKENVFKQSCDSSEITIVINGQLMITGKKSTEDDGEITFIVPLLELLNNLEVKIDWNNEKTAELTYNGNIWELDLSTISLIQNDNNDNLLITPPGCSYGSKVDGKEVFVEFPLFSYIASRFGIKIESVHILNDTISIVSAK